MTPTATALRDLQATISGLEAATATAAAAVLLALNPSGDPDPAEAARAFAGAEHALAAVRTAAGRVAAAIAAEGRPGAD